MRATFPIDPVGNGTWVAANDAGLVLALLNRHPLMALGSTGSTASAAAKRSRGVIIPRLLRAVRIATVRDELNNVDPIEYAPFQLVGVCGRGLLVATSDGRELSIATDGLREPLMFTSSSLGDRDALRVRKPLFDSLVGRGHDPLTGQKQFHDHSWPACPSFSVRMQRPDARTVSRAIIHVHKRRVTFSYEALAF
jgi:hypothetical protein